MQQSLPTQFRSTAIWLCLALVVHLGAAEAHGQQTMGSLKADRILFLGNSLTLHGPLPEIHWTGNWGMAASAQDKDYVHLLATAINARTGGKLVVEPTPVDGKKSAENVITACRVANVPHHEAIGSPGSRVSRRNALIRFGEGNAPFVCSVHLTIYEQTNWYC